jgi:hypothetical protein
MLHLYHIFLEFAPKKDHKALKKAIISLEDDLGEFSEEEYEEEVKASTAPPNPLANLGGFASSLFQGMNETAAASNIPKDQMPDFGKMIGSALDNPAIQNVFKSLLSNVAGGQGTGQPPNLENALGQFAQTITSPEFKDAIVTTAAETATSAVSDEPGVTSTESSDGPKGVDPPDLPRSEE